MKFSSRRREGQQPLVDKIPQCDHGAVLITSRTNTGVDIAIEPENEIHVGAFDEQTSLQLLSNKLGRKLYSDDEAKELASELEHIALALTQAARYISSTKQPIAYYLQLFRQEERRQVDLLGKEWRDLRRDTSVSNAVLTSWRITWDQLRKECYLAAQLLARMSLLDRQRIPRFLVLKFKNRKDQLPDQRRLEAMGMLLQYGLCWESGETTDSGYTMHRLVQVCTKAWLREAGKLPAWERHVVSLVGWFAYDEKLWIDLELHARAILPHVMSSGRLRHQLPIFGLLLRAASWEQRDDTLIELLDHAIAFCRSRSNESQSLAIELVHFRTERAKFQLSEDPSSVSLAELESLRVDYGPTSGYQDHDRISLDILIIDKRYPGDKEAIAALEALLEDMKNAPPGETSTGSVMVLIMGLLPKCAFTGQFGRARKAISCAREIADKTLAHDSVSEGALQRIETSLLGMCGERREEAALLSRVPFDESLDVPLDVSDNAASSLLYLIVFYIRWNKHNKAETVFNKTAALYARKGVGRKGLLPCLALRLAHKFASDPRAYLQMIWDRWETSLGMRLFEELWRAYTDGVVHEVDWRGKIYEVDWRGDFWLYVSCPW